MGNNNGSTAVENRQAENAALVAASEAGSTVAANGGGDIAVLNARLAELDKRRKVEIKIAHRRYDADMAEIEDLRSLGRSGGRTMKRDDGTVETPEARAARIRDEAIESAETFYAESAQTFAAAKGFINHLPDEMVDGVLGRVISQREAALLQALKTAQRAGREYVSLANGRNRNVAEWIAMIEATQPGLEGEAEVTAVIDPES